MKTLVWVEHDNQNLKDATLSAVTAAAKLGEVHLLVAGQGVDGVAKQAAAIEGVGKVHVADDAAYAHFLAENVAPLIVSLMGSHDAVLFPATTTGKNIAPRSLAKLIQPRPLLNTCPLQASKPIQASKGCRTWCCHQSFCGKLTRKQR